MKKIILTLFIAAASVSVASAQITWGVKAGFNYSTYKIGVENATPSVNLGWKPGFYVGAVNNITLSRDWSLQSELQYSLDGTRLGLGSDLVGVIAEDVTGGSLSFNKNLAASVCMHNLRLPIMVKFQPMGRLSVMAGPYLSYRVGEKLNMNDNLKTLLEQAVLTPSSNMTINSIEDTAKDVIKDNVRKFDVGVAVGAEFRLCNGIFIDFRYSLSLLNSLGDKVKFNGEETPWSDVIGMDIQPTMKYSALQLGLGYRF